MTSFDCDVVVVGYGPVGATAANLLARRGLSVAVVEAQADIYDKPRAISLDHEMMRTFQWCGIAERLEPLLGPHPGVDYVGMDGRVIQRLDPQPPPYPLGWPPNASFIQPELEALLRAAVAECSQVQVLAPCEAVGIEQDAAGVSVAVKPPGAVTRTLRACYLLGCDGANSFVRRRLGPPIEDLGFDEWWVVVDTRLRRPADLPEKFIQYCRPSRPATFIKGPRDLRRWEIKLLPGERPEEFTHERILQLLSGFVDPAAIDIWRAAVYRFHALIAARWRTGRVFLLGDAAHQMPPFMGQGLCSGVRDVANLVWKLERVLRRNASGALLDSYEEERKPHIREMVRLAKRFGEVVGELDVEAARRRDATMRAKLESGESETNRQKYIPGLIAGLIDLDGGRPAGPAGTMFVQPKISGEGMQDRRLDDVIAPGFLIAARDAGTHAWLDEDGRALWQRIGGERIAISTERPATDSGVRAFTERDGLFDAWLRAHGCAAAVVRPDCYVYGAARDRAGLNRLVRTVGGRLFASS